MDTNGASGGFQFRSEIFTAINKKNYEFLSCSGQRCCCLYIYMRLIRSLELLRTSIMVLGMGQVRNTGRSLCVSFLLLNYCIS